MNKRLLFPRKYESFTYVIRLLTKYVYLHNTFTYVIIRNFRKLFNNLSHRGLRDAQLDRVRLKLRNPQVSRFSIFALVLSF